MQREHEKISFNSKGLIVQLQILPNAMDTTIVCRKETFLQLVSIVSESRLWMEWVTRPQSTVGKLTPLTL